MTERLYYEDSHRQEFTARVVSCIWNEKKKVYDTVLDRTAFFPEGGGQYADPGVLGGVQVKDVHERGGEVVHELDQALPVGAEVAGKIDFEIRFSRMQQHTGEHIVSGIVHRRFGYDNVGFHLGDEAVTMDFNGPLTMEQLRLVEREANEAVAANLPVIASCPSKDELKTLDYRSKIEIEGQVRIVTIPGYDVCACCAPHVDRTGEIGVIKLTDMIKYKGGARVTAQCGFRALADYNKKEESVRDISRLLSAKPDEVAAAVGRLQKEAQSAKEKLIRLQERWMERKLLELSAEKNGEPAADIVLFEEELDKNVARRFVDAGKEKCTGICALFVGSDAAGYQYIFGSRSINFKEFLKAFHQVCPGRGGGRGEMVQGTVHAGEDTLRRAVTVR